MAKKQIINPLVRFRQKAQGRYANRIGGSTHARAVTLDETKCFYVVSVTVGDPDATWYTVCFNTTPEQLTCLTTDFVFRNLTNTNPTFFQNFNNPGGNCLQYSYDTSSERESAGPNDTIVMDYTPGTCRKDSSTEDECLLEAIADYPVTNNIWGPTTVRVGDFADNIVAAFFPLNNPPATIGLNWTIKVNTVVQAGVTSQIVDNRIEFTLQNNVLPGDTVEITQSNVNDCRAANGQFCWRFYDQPVDNAVGVDFWVKEDNDAWLIEGVGRWQLG